MASYPKDPARSRSPFSKTNSPSSTARSSGSSASSGFLAGTASTSPRQQEFIDCLLRDPQAQFGADLITGDLEELKAAIHAALKKLEAPQPPPAAARNLPRRVRKLVYLICDERDRKATIPLRKSLKAQGFESNLPAFEGDAATVASRTKTC